MISTTQFVPLILQKIVGNTGTKNGNMAPHFHLFAKVSYIWSTCANIIIRINTKFDQDWFYSLFTIFIAGHKLDDELNSTASLTTEIGQHKDHKGIVSFKYSKSNKTA